MANAYPTRKKTKANAALRRGKCQLAGDVVPSTARPHRGITRAPNSESNSHFTSGTGARRGGRGGRPPADHGGAEPGARPRHCGGDAARGGGAAEGEGVAGQTARGGGAEGLGGALQGPCGGAGTAGGYRPKPEAATGGRRRRAEGSRPWRVAPVVPAAPRGRAAAAAAPGPHKEETAQLVPGLPPSPGPAPKGRGQLLWDPGENATRKKHFLPGPPPRTDSRVLRSRRPRGLPSGLRAQPPPILPQVALRFAGEIRSCLRLFPPQLG